MWDEERSEKDSGEKDQRSYVNGYKRDRVGSGG